MNEVNASVSPRGALETLGNVAWTPKDELIFSLDFKWSYSFSNSTLSPHFIGDLKRRKKISLVFKVSLFKYILCHEFLKFLIQSHDTLEEHRDLNDLEYISLDK